MLQKFHKRSLYVELESGVKSFDFECLISRVKDLKGNPTHATYLPSSILLLSCVRTSWRTKLWKIKQRRIIFEGRGVRQILNLEVPGSNIGPETEIFFLVFLTLARKIPGKYQIKPRPFPSTLFPIHFSLLSDPMRFELLYLIRCWTQLR